MKLIRILFVGISLMLLISCQFEGNQNQVPPQPPLSQLSADPIQTIISTDSFVDPAYGTKIRRLTSVTDGEGRMRHEYARRQAFNADQSYLLAQDGTGHWFLYETQTGKLKQSLPDLVGDSEPIWHPEKAGQLYFTARGGGSAWWLLDVKTGHKELIYDFSKDGIWPEATAYWTRGEGTSSADGRYLSLMATRYDTANQKTEVYGLVVLDLIDKRVIGRLDASQFPTPDALPDHISTAPSGRYVVVSWLAEDGGTVAYSLDFKNARQLTLGSEHSDLAVGTEGQDLLVYADYQAGYIQAIEVATGKRQNLHPLYPAKGEGYAVHISGQAFERPGWAVISTYADYADYGATSPASQLRAEYQKVWLMELKAGGNRLNLTHTRSDASLITEDDTYFLEPQASSSRDLTKIVFASNMGGAIETYLIDLPRGVID